MRYTPIIMLSVLVCLLLGLTPQVVLAKKDCSLSEVRHVVEHPNDVQEFLGTKLYTGAIERQNHYDAVVVGYKRGEFNVCKVYETDPNVSTIATQLNEWGGRVFVTLVTNGNVPELNPYTVNGWIR